MDEPSQSPRGQSTHRPRAPLVVGVGASAGAMNSIERFFSRLSLDSQQAIVLVLQHREAFDEGWLRGVLGRIDGAQFAMASDGTEIKGNTIYLCAANMITTIQDSKFAVRPAHRPPGEQAMIDSFLVSLAEERAEESIGVVLAGTDGDGTLGVATLKDHGGLALAEKVAGINPDQLAESRTPVAIADFVLPPEEIPEHIRVYARHLRRLEERLQATIEELEITNKEYQSLNEELQSANEQLSTVNEKLAHRVQELTRATSDLESFLEGTQIAAVFLDNDLRVMNFTPAITQVLHLVETDVGRPIAHIKACIPIEDLYDDVRRVLRTLASAEHELTAPDSGTRYIVRILPYRRVDNFVAGVVITFIGVTAITRAEERQRLLLAELQHRVRNTLGVVRSIARRSAETSTSVEEYASHLDGRLNALARIQAMVNRGPEGGFDLEYLIVEELLGYNAREGDQLRVSGPPVRFLPKAAETLALALHELATNAIKYGALSQPAGRVDVSWRLDDGDGTTRLIFDWRERGGPPVTPPKRKGFGIELLERTLAFELKGKTTLTFNPSGLHCTILIPLNRRIVHSPLVGA